MDKRRLFFGALLNIVEGWNLSTAVNTSISDVTQTTTNTLYVNDALLKLYIISSGRTMREYSISNLDNMDVLTELNSVSLDAFSGSTIRGLDFKPDGTRMFFINSEDFIKDISLSVAWDSSSTLNLVNSFFVGSYDNQPFGFQWNSDGSKFIFNGNQNLKVYQFSVSTNYDLGSTVAFIQDFYYGGTNSYATGLRYSDDYTKLYLVNTLTDFIHQYNLSIADDISTMVHFYGLNVNPPYSQPEDVRFNIEGTRMYLANGNTAYIPIYTLTE